MSALSAKSSLSRTNPLIFLVLTSLLLACLLTTAPARAEDMAKVVYHVDFMQPKRFSAMLTNIINMATYYEDNLMDYDIRVVFHGNGMRFVTDDKLAGTPFAEDEELAGMRENLRGRMKTLIDMHKVSYELCNITRTGTGLPEDKIYAAVKLVPSGVVRIAELQQKQGYAYLKVQ